MPEAPAPQAPLIAVVEDEDHLAQGLIFNLEADGYRTHHERDGEAALRYLLTTEDEPSAVLLDVMLPGRDGFSIAQALRGAGRFTPILLLTARSRTEDVLEGFAAGADDYLPKPFDLNVLLARLHSLLRRTAWQRSPAPPSLASSDPEPADVAAATPEILQIGDRVIDFSLLEIRPLYANGPVQALAPSADPQPSPSIAASAGEARDTRIHLTLMEAELLRYLLAHCDRVVSRKEILEEVWHVQADTDTRPIDNFIVRLRRYLEPDPTSPIYLLTARGVGYRFVPPAGTGGLSGNDPQP